MSETNNSLRIRTQVNGESSVSVQLDQTYDSFEILSLKMKSENVYRLHSANYGVIVGRVLANENFGVPNAKVSIFIEGDFENENQEIVALYPYETTATLNGDGVKYNLLPDNKVDDCHQVVGTFPNKTYLLDNDVLIEVFDKYYKYTTRTNNSGDYIIAGVPTGSQMLHMDLDLSDCGILSQRPRDFVYKGYTIEQFENPNQFKTSTDLSTLSQIFSQDQVVNVIPFWGNEENGDTIGITRADIKISFKFEPTCVFIGSVVADNSSNGISKKCVPTNKMGAMDELTTGEGTIEMIRKTPGGNVEEFQVKGTQLIDGNGIWCYQIPMNLDYMMTDEYGNMVPTDDPSKGIPTRTRVRFRVSMQDMEMNTDNFFRAKVLVPHNPQNYSGTTGKHEDYDYEFGSETRDESFRDLMWNNVYTVKSYIPRFQKSRMMKSERFTGIKHCNIYGNNNPMPYNNIRIRLPLMFTILCVLIKSYIRIVYVINSLIAFVAETLVSLIGGPAAQNLIGLGFVPDRYLQFLEKIRFVSLSDGLCPDLDNWYFAPGKRNYAWKNNTERKLFGIFKIGKRNKVDFNLLKQTFEGLISGGEDNSDELNDKTSIDVANKDSDTDNVCLTMKTDYLISCVEMALAQEYKVINFDFYNDWINGVIYMPRWMRFVRKKRRLLFGLITIKPKVKACVDDTSIFNKTRLYVQQCALSYKKSSNGLYTTIASQNGCTNNSKQKCHKKNGRKRYAIFGGRVSRSINGNGGIVHEDETSKQQYVYYLKPCEWRYGNNKKTILFANDIVLLGSLLDCNIYGIPQAFKYLTGSSYVMPTNLALTNMDEDGNLYTGTDDMTICTGSDAANNINLNNANKSLSQVSNSFSGISNYYSDSDEVQYGLLTDDPEANLFDDTIPITEAAGIAWNYTGPDQGIKSDNVKNSLYMPGGHFLGISCINSETNIKSCVNLQRICEAGANMSQRREEIRAIDTGYNRYDIRYRYYVPTGLISNDEINNPEFRTMFATMNHKRLLCENTFDEKTGYPIYDFIYLRNSGFEGNLNDKITNDRTKFNFWNKNMSAETIDEYNYLSRQSGSNILKDADYDNDETKQTYTRTLENTNIEYYMFRFGLTSLNDDEQKKRFLITDSSTVSLPQYENSFYFYFGLHDGATAFDEFNKQFFSTCESESIIKKKLSLSLRETTDSCMFISNVTLTGRDVVGRLSISYTYYDGTQDVVVNVDSDDIKLENGSYECTVEGLPYGTYTFTVSDDSGYDNSKTIVLGDGIISSSVNVTPFSFRTNGSTNYQQISQSAKTNNSGYVEIGDLFIDGIMISIINAIIVEKDNQGNNVRQFSTNGIYLDGATRVSAQSVSSDNYLKVYLWNPDAKYDIYIFNGYEGDCGVVDPVYTYYTTVTVDGIDGLDLYLGSYYLPYSTKLKNLSGTNDWWTGTTVVANDNNDTLEKWCYRYGLMRRTDDDNAYYLNKIFSTKKPNDREIDSMLYGQPEKSDRTLVNGVYYEDDIRFGNGVISDRTLIPTTGPISSGRTVFGEMAYYGNTIGSDKISEGTVTMVTSDSTDMVHTIILNGVSVGNYVRDNHGCVGKTSDGTILHLIKNPSSNSFVYEGEPVNVGEKVSIYPIFYYPIIYKPFYSKVYIADWINMTLEQSTDTFDSSTMTCEYNDERFITSGIVYNGLTFNNKFDSNSYFNTSNDEEDNLITITRDSGNNDIAPLNGDSIARFKVDNLAFTGTQKNDYYAYEITENSPSGTSYNDDYVSKVVRHPYNIELNTISDSIDADFANTISYRAHDTVYRFNNDTNDTTNTYYLLPKPNGQDVLTNKKYVYNTIGTTLYLACKFGADSDSKLGITSSVKLNQPESIVIIEINNSNTCKFPYKASSESSALVEKQFSNNNVTQNKVKNGNQDVTNYLKSTFDITPIIGYSALNNGFNIESVVNELVTGGTSSQLIRFNEDTVLTIDINNYYAVGFSQNTVNNKGNTYIVRIYNDLIKLQDYSSNSEEPTMNIVETGLTFDATGGTKTVTINANVNWRVTLSGGSWAKFADTISSDMQGSVTSTLSIIAEENTETSQRTMTLKCDDESGSGLPQKTITIKQSGATVTNG